MNANPAQPAADASDDEWNAWRAVMRVRLGLPQPLSTETFEARARSRCGGPLKWEFRAGPRRGTWSYSIPSYCELLKAERRYLGTIDAVLRPLKMRRGKKAHRAARDRAVVDLFGALALPKRNRAAVIARQLGLTVGHVRKVLARAEKRAST